MKVFPSLFSKSDRPSKGAQPLVARRNGRNFIHAVFGSFCGNFAKKNGVGFLT